MIQLEQQQHGEFVGGVGGCGGWWLTPTIPISSSLGLDQKCFKWENGKFVNLKNLTSEKHALN